MEVGETKVAYSERPQNKLFYSKNELERNNRETKQVKI
jgi:hypothetical protein